MREHRLREIALQIAGQLGVTAREDAAHQEKSNKLLGGAAPSARTNDISHHCPARTPSACAGVSSAIRVTEYK